MYSEFIKKVVNINISQMKNSVVILQSGIFKCIHLQRRRPILLHNIVEFEEVSFFFYF